MNLFRSDLIRRNAGHVNPVFHCTLTGSPPDSPPSSLANSRCPITRALAASSCSRRSGLPVIVHSMADRYRLGSLRAELLRQAQDGAGTSAGRAQPGRVAASREKRTVPPVTEGVGTGDDVLADVCLDPRNLGDRRPAALGWTAVCGRCRRAVGGSRRRALDRPHSRSWRRPGLR